MNEEAIIVDIHTWHVMAGLLLIFMVGSVAGLVMILFERER